MNINSDINVLGSLSDFSLIGVLLEKKLGPESKNEILQESTSIKTFKSYKRFVNAIHSTLIKFDNENIANLVHSVFKYEGLSNICLLLLFWNASVNNRLLACLNEDVFFPALFSGRTSLKKVEVTAYLKELRQKEEDIKKWSDSTINTTASKYLTFLKKFNLMKGKNKKVITAPKMGEKEIVLFIYWLLSVEENSNLLDSKWLKYCFLEKEIFIEQIIQKRFMKYYNLQFSGNNLKVQPNFTYKELYNELH
jgi:hypothetical protein